MAETLESAAQACFETHDITETGSETTSSETFGSGTKAVCGADETRISGTKIISSRAEIDTSPPFGSVKEAVTRFGGSGSWIPHHVLEEPEHAVEEVDMDKVEERAAQLENDLIMKEQETLDVLKELETTKRIVEELKLTLQKQASECTGTPDLSSGDKMSTPAIKEMNKNNFKIDGKSEGSSSWSPTYASPGLILVELKQAKSKLSKTTNDLTVIRASVESLNKKTKKEKMSLENFYERLTSNSAGVLSHEEQQNRTRVKKQMANAAETEGGFENLTNISCELQQLNSTVEQFKTMAEAAKFEVLRAMSEIEQTKTSMKTAEMRWVAARKMGEAARAVEAVALAEIKGLSNSESSSRVFLQKPEGVTLSFEEYSSLSHKARKAVELSKKTGVGAMLQIDEANVSELAILKKSEAATGEVKHSKKALEEALNRVEVANRRKLAADEALQRWRSEHGQEKQSANYSTKFRNSSTSSHHGNSRPSDVKKSNLVNVESKPDLRPTISIGDILSRKPIKPEGFVVRKQMEGHTEGQKVSLSQMLHKQNRVLSPPTKSMKDGSDQKQFFGQRKKFGFIHISLPLTKQSKKKKEKIMQASSLR